MTFWQFIVLAFFVVPAVKVILGITPANKKDLDGNDK